MVNKKHDAMEKLIEALENAKKVGFTEHSVVGVAQCIMKEK
jgi:hypothetical protein